MTIHLLKFEIYFMHVLITFLLRNEYHLQMDLVDLKYN